MLAALTRAVSRTLGSCELTWLARQRIDIDLAIEQHKQYERSLTAMGIRVISLPEQPEMPDAVFVEDPLLVLDEMAIVTRMGSVSRRAESDSLAEAISTFRPMRRLVVDDDDEPAPTLEGGDVMRIGRDVFVGLSSRTNAAGVRQLTRELEPYGYRVRSVEVRGCLHLKSACCPLGDGKILANRAWLNPTPLRDYKIVEVSPDEPGAANILRVGSTVLMPASFPQTRSIIIGEGLGVLTVDISELMKAEAAVTCSSVIFEA